MHRFLTKRRVALLLVTAVAAIAAAAGYAYFTSTGSGTGTASVGSSSAVTLHGTTSGTLYPGSSGTVSFTVDNPSNGNEYVGTIHLASVTTDAGHSACVMSDFTMPDVTVNHDFAPGSGQAVTPTGTLTMADNGNQDACQGAPLTLHLTSN
jgi:hypothetical protein